MTVDEPIELTDPPPEPTPRLAKSTPRLRRLPYLPMPAPVEGAKREANAPADGWIPSRRRLRTESELLPPTDRRAAMPPRPSAPPDPPRRATPLPAPALTPPEPPRGEPVPWQELPASRLVRQPDLLAGPVARRAVSVPLERPSARRRATPAVAAMQGRRAAAPHLGGTDAPAAPSTPGMPAGELLAEVEATAEQIGQGIAEAVLDALARVVPDIVRQALRVTETWFADAI